MSISNGHLRYKRHIKQEDGSYKLVSHWTSAETVELSNGLTLEESQIELTQAEYNALSEEEKNNGTTYFITDAESSGGSGAVGVDITKEEYDALSEEEKNNGTIYFVEDESEIMGASNIPYDNSVSEMEAKSVQGAIDEVNEKIEANEAAISNANKTVAENAADIAENAAAITKLNSDKANFETVGNVSFVRATEQVNITNIENTKMIKLYADDFLIPDLGSVRGLYSDKQNKLILDVYGGDIDTITEHLSCYICRFGMTSGVVPTGTPPVNQAGVLVTLNPNQYYRTQIYVCTNNNSNMYVRTTINTAWSNWSRITSESDLSTLTDGAFTSSGNTLSCYAQNVKVVRNAVTKLCTVTGDVMLGSNAITAGTMFALGSINFKPIKGVYGLFGAFAKTNTINTTTGSNLVEVCVESTGGMYAYVPYAKASGTASHTIPFHFSFYTT